LNVLLGYAQLLPELLLRQATDDAPFDESRREIRERGQYPLADLALAESFVLGNLLPKLIKLTPQAVDHRLLKSRMDL